MLRFISKGLCISTLVFLALSTAGRAQVLAGSAEASGNVGFSNLSGSETVDGNKHAAFGGAGFYNFTDMASLGFEYSYQMLGSEAVSGASVSGHIQSYGAVYRQSLLNSGRVIPYALVAGGGLSETAVGSAEGVHASASQSGAYFGFGGGVSVYAGPRWGIRPEFRYERQQFSSTTIGGVNIASYGQNYVLGTISVFYQFGGKQTMKK